MCECVPWCLCAIYLGAFVTNIHILHTLCVWSFARVTTIWFYDYNNLFRSHSITSSSLDLLFLWDLSPSLFVFISHLIHICNGFYFCFAFLFAASLSLFLKIVRTSKVNKYNHSNCFAYAEYHAVTADNWKRRTQKFCFIKCIYVV